jgi:hypothetical protein
VRLAWHRSFGCRCSGALDSRSRALLPTRFEFTATPLQGPCARAHTEEGCCKSPTWTLGRSGRPDLRARGAHRRLLSPSTGYGAPYGSVTRGPAVGVPGADSLDRANADRASATDRNSIRDSGASCLLRQALVRCGVRRGALPSARPQPQR